MLVRCQTEEDAEPVEIAVERVTRWGVEYLHVPSYGLSPGGRLVTLSVAERLRLTRALEEAQ